MNPIFFILNVPLSQEGAFRSVTISLVSSSGFSDWKLTGAVGVTNRFSIENPMITDTVMISDITSELSLMVSGSFSYRVSGVGNWSSGYVSFSPSRVTFAAGEIGGKTVRATGSTSGI